MSKLGILAMTLGVLAIVAAPANAQSINKNAKEKVRWYTAPREIQIIDDRPVVKDFREAPAAAQSIQLPPGPQSGGGYGGGGGGAMGGDDGGTLPAGGMPMGGGGPGYRTDGPGGPVGLPKADFGHAQTNIPARGMGPRGPLPGGYTTNRLAGKMMPWSPGQGVNPNVARQVGGSRPVARQAAPAATYAAPGGGYGPSVGGGSYGGGGSSTSVSAKLLKKIK